MSIVICVLGIVLGLGLAVTILTYIAIAVLNAILSDLEL